MVEFEKQSASWRSNAFEPVSVWSAMLRLRTLTWALLTFALAAGILALAQLPSLLSMIDGNQPEQVLALAPGMVWGVSWVMLNITAALQILVQAVLLVILIKLNRTRPEQAQASPTPGASTPDWRAKRIWQPVLGFMVYASLPFALQMLAHGLIGLAGGSMDLNGLTWLVSDNARPRDALAGLMWQILWQFDPFFLTHVLVVCLALDQIFRIDRSNLVFASFIYAMSCALMRAIVIAAMQAV